jgi:hypothetical protein
MRAVRNLICGSLLGQLTGTYPFVVDVKEGSEGSAESSTKMGATLQQTNLHRFQKPAPQS